MNDLFSDPFWTNVYIPIIIGIFTTVIMSIVASVVKYIFLSSSPHSGEWESIVYHESRKIMKKDKINLKHNKRNGQIHGTIKREFPLNQNKRNWKFTGIINGDHIIATHWSNPAVKSDGCSYSCLVDDFKYEGYYFRVNDRGEIEKFKITLQKSDKKNYRPQ